MATAARRRVAPAPPELVALIVGILVLVIGIAVALVVGAADLPGSAAVGEAGVADADRDQTMAWFARILLWLGLSWLVIGMVSARTRLVGRPGAAAARASWIASTRPWRARESTLGMLPLDRWLMILVPGALLVATRAVQTSLLGWLHLAAAVGGWLVFVGVVRIVVGRRSPWPVIAAVGGVIMVRCIVTLIALSIAGPGGYWLALWSVPVVRGVSIALGVALLLWAYVAAGWALAVQLGRRRATGAVLAAAGAALAIPALSIVIAGPTHVLAAWVAELGLTQYSDESVALVVPPGAGWALVVVGALVAVVGIVLTLPHRGVGGRA